MQRPPRTGHETDIWARGPALAAVAVALFVGAFDQTVVAIALPRIVEDLDGMSRYTVVATAYLVAATVMVPVYGRLADTFPRMPLLVAATSVFSVGAIGAAVAGSFGDLPVIGDGMNQLVVARAVQGIGGAGMFALSTIVLAGMFTPRERGRYHGLLGAAIGLATVLAPWFGGWLTDHGSTAIAGVAGWRWVFLATIPAALLAIVLSVRGSRTVTRARGRWRLDAISAFASTLALGALVVALQLDRAVHPWSGAITVGLFTLSASAGLAFVVRSMRVRDPILHVTLYARPVFVTTLSSAFVLGAVFLSVVFFVPLYLIQVMGSSATEAGIALMPVSITAVFGALLAGQIASRTGRYKALMVTSMVMLAIGSTLLANLPAVDPSGALTRALLVVGLGIGLGLPLYTLAIQNALVDGRVGEATSLSHLARQLGGTIAVAVMGTVLATTFDATLGRDADGSSSAGVGRFAIGSAWIGTLEREAMDGIDVVADAIVAGDMTALLDALEAGLVPADARLGVVAATTFALGDAARREGIARDARERLTAEVRSRIVGLAGEVEHAFRVALDGVFDLLAWFAAAGIIVAAFVPDGRLRGRSVGAAA